MEESTTTSEAATEEQTTAPRTFSPDEVEGIVKDRLARERKKYAEFDSLKEKAAEFDRIKAEQMSDAEKSALRIKELEEGLAARDALIKGAERRDLATAAALEVAKELGVNPDAALKWAAKLDGEDADSMKESARSLFGAFAGTTPPPPENIDQGALATGDDSDDPFIAALRS